jgi:hypothetical protein
MGLVKLRSDLERALRQLVQQHDLLDAPPTLKAMLERLAEIQVLPPSARAIGDTLRVLNAAARGADVSVEVATAALEAGARFLDELQQLKDSK